MLKNIRLEQASVSLEAIFSAMPVALALIDREGRHVALNQALASISGLTARELVGRKVSDLSPESGKNIEANFRQFDAGLEVPEHELGIGERVFHVAVKALRNDDAHAIGLMVAMTDISQQKETEQLLAEANARLENYARQDYLTELWNRRHFDDILERQISRALREHTPLSLVMLDVDNFKGYNDEYGHAAGDDCLRAVAGALRQSLRRPSDEPCRYGGEEFALLLPNTGVAGASLMAEYIRAAVERLQLAHARTTLGHVTISLGVASLDATGQDAQSMRNALVRSADQALYAAKNAGRNAVRVWGQAMGDVGWGELENDFFLGTLLPRVY